MKKIILLLFSFLIVGCAGSKISQTKGGYLNKTMRIALSPSGGIVADAIGIEMFNRGMKIIDTQQMTNIMARYNLNEIEISMPKNLLKLTNEGIDAVMFVKSVSGRDNKPQSISIRINNTIDWSIISGISWQNGWGGAPGSLNDRLHRKDIIEAAKEIVDGLLHGED